MMKNIVAYFNRPFFGHLLFWIAVYLYFLLSGNETGNYKSIQQLFECYGLIVLAQMVTAYSCIYFLMPKFLDRKKVVPFIIWLVVLLFCVSTLHTFVKTYYYESKYFGVSDVLDSNEAITSNLSKLTSIPSFISKSILLLTPTVLLLMSRFYRNQRDFLKVNEQKKIAELTALKQQLNPHFLFNTLNNLYALAIEKSERTPDVIERLSDILDYILYRCKKNYVSVQKEIELIENYLSLEKIRYGNRVAVSFNHDVEPEVKIAPLILLTFIENAFKHGVSQELKKAVINISLTSDHKELHFSICNSKPNNTIGKNPDNEEPLGLENVNKQLELLYPNSHNLTICDKGHNFEVILRLKKK